MARLAARKLNLPLQAQTLGKKTKECAEQAEKVMAAFERRLKQRLSAADLQSVNRICVFALPLAVGLSASSQMIEEWQPAKWGMTEQQVLSAFPGVARLPRATDNYPDVPRRLMIDEVAVGGIPLRASFVFDATGKLDRIQLAPAAVLPAFEKATSADMALTDGWFEKIEASLTRKYGEPTRAESDTTFLSAWVLPGSTVRLIYIPSGLWSLQFERRRDETTESFWQGLAPIRGKHVFPERSSWKIVSIESRVTESNQTWARYAWKLTLRNESDRPNFFYGTVEFQDRDGFVVDTTSTGQIVVAARSEEVFTGFALIRAQVAGQVARTVAKVKQMRR